MTASVPGGGGHGVVHVRDILARAAVEHWPVPVDTGQASRRHLLHQADDHPTEYLPRVDAERARRRRATADGGDVG